MSPTRESIVLLLVVAAWPPYLVGTTLLWKWSPWAGLASVLVAGGHLFTWLAYLRHELWHNYFPLLNNRQMFDVVSWFIFSDPQVFRHVHAGHHKYVHTEADLEFFCEDHSSDPVKRRRQFQAELLFGNIAWEVRTLFRLFRSGKASRWRSRGAIAVRLLFLGLLMATAEWLQPGASPFVLLTVMSTVWLGAWLTRQNQWIEHLGILAPDRSMEERNSMTRNLPGDRLLHRLWNAYTHQEARNHGLHHTQPGSNTRGSTSPPDGQFTSETSLREHVERLVLTWKETGAAIRESGVEKARGGRGRARGVILLTLLVAWSIRHEIPAALSRARAGGGREVSRVVSLPPIEGHEPDALEQWLSVCLLTSPLDAGEDMPPVLMRLRPLPRDWDEAESWIARRLARAPEGSRQAFREQLEDPSQPTPLRCLLARVFSRTGDPRALSYLEQIVDIGETGTLLWESLLAISAHPDRSPGERIRRWADSAQGWGRQYAFVALRRLRDPCASDLARRALKDMEPAVVRHAAMYLLEFGAPEDRQLVDSYSREHWDIDTRGILRRLLDGEARVP